MVEFVLNSPMPSESSFSGKIPPWNANNISHCDQLSFLNTVSYWETMLTLFSTSLWLKFAFVYYMEFIFKDRYKRPLIFLKTSGFYILSFIYLHFFFFVFSKQDFFVYISSCPGTHSVHQDGLELIEIHLLLLPWVLELKKCTATTWWYFAF